MPAKLYVVHGSHPCNTVTRALEMKGIAVKLVEFPPPVHAVAMPLLFSARTVPGIRFEDGEKVQGSRAILRRLDERVPDPPLVPAEPGARARVLEAERWGDEVLQSAARRILWPTLLQHPGAAPSFSEGSKLPLPAPVLKASIPLIARIEQKMNKTSAATRDADLRTLPAWLDKVDAWIADGTLDGPQVNAADLQIAASLALLMQLADLRAVIAPRPCGALADRLFGGLSGHIPAGALPASLLPA